MSGDPRIALFGNVANNFFQISRMLRETQSMDVHLFIEHESGPTTRPESDVPSLEQRLPDWIHEGRYVKGARLRPWRSPIVTDLRGFDLIVVSGDGLMFAPYVGRPYCFFVTGGDLTLTPFPLRFLTWHRTLRQRTAAFPMGLWQRRGIRRATEIWAAPHFNWLDPLRRLGVPESRLGSRYLPVVIDTDRFVYRPEAVARGGAAVRTLVDGSDFVVFHPSRLLIRDRPRLRAVGQWKRNDLLIRGFAEFVCRRGAQSPVLGLIDRPDSRDMAIARQLISELGIEEFVRWLVAPRREGFTRSELLDLYSVADVVTDDFGVGWFGAITLEGLSVGKPVLGFIDESWMRTLYPWHPVLSAGTVTEVADELTRLYESPSERAALGARGREWVEEFHSCASGAEQYAAAIRDVIARLGAESGRAAAGGN